MLRRSNVFLFGDRPGDVFHTHRVSGLKIFLLLGASPFQVIDIDCVPYEFGGRNWPLLYVCKLIDWVKRIRWLSISLEGCEIGLRLRYVLIA
jgi:hypothetical protein